MNIFQIAAQAATQGAQLIRYRPESIKTGTAQYDSKHFTGTKRGWIILDASTASAIVAVHNALNESNQAKFLNLPLEKLVSFCWKHVS